MNGLNNKLLCCQLFGFVSCPSYELTSLNALYFSGLTDKIKIRKKRLEKNKD